MKRRTTWLVGSVVVVMMGVGCDVVIGLNAFYDCPGDPRCPASPACDINGKRDGKETDVDCGGSCAPCGDGKGCSSGADCTSKVCVSGTCHAPACDDGAQNGNETDVDCGGSCGATCGAGKTCLGDGDCKGGACTAGMCAPTCTDGEKDQDETGVDCGGKTCAACPDGQGCAGNGDCTSGVCSGATCRSYYEWSEMFGTMGANDANAVRGVAADASGDVVFTGPLYGTVDFGGGGLTAAAPAGDLYVAKLDSAGKHVWSKRFGGGLAAFGVAAATDSTESVVIAGGHIGDLTIGGSTVYNGGGTGPLGDVFVAKFDKVGHPSWAVPGTGGGKYNYASAVAIDTADNVVIAGQVQIATAFPGAPGVASAGGLDAFLARLSPNGLASWVKVFGDAATQAGTGAAVDGSGNIVFAATSNSSLDLGGGALGNSGGTDAYLAKFDTSGNHIWSKHFGGLTTAVARVRVAVDATGAIFLAGIFGGSIDLGGDMLMSAGANDIFVAKFDAMGNRQWSKRFGDASDQSAVDLALDGTGGILLHGHFQGTVDFGGGPLVSTASGSPGGNLFVAKLDTTGAHVWSHRFGDTFPIYAFGVAAAPSGGVFIGGFFTGVLDFTGMNPLTNLGNSSGYVAKLMTP